MSHFSHYLSALEQAIMQFGWQTEVMLDAQQSTWSYQRFLSTAVAYQPLYTSVTVNNKIGLLLPNHPSSLACLFSAWLSERSVGMLNITSGASGIRSACQVAGISFIISRRTFLQAIGAEHLVSELQDVSWLWLDEVTEIPLLADVSVAPMITQVTTTLDDEAVVLFTSGSEGMPKGVSLSHRNLLVNIDQTCQRLPFQSDERFFIALPMFHSFGLTVGCLLPLLQGFHVYLFPSPLMVKAIPPAIQQHQSTVLFGSSTFFNQWGKNAEVDAFQSLRMVIAGAEKLQPHVRELWKNQFNIDILEGYGVTETSPVIAVNIPVDNSVDSVGKLIHGMEARLAPVEGLAKGGRLQVRGENVMRGYYLADHPAVVTPLSQLFEQDGWYDTGDLADIDEQGYVSILGRAKRFAKIGGEMVSLEITEHLARQLYPEAQHAAVAIADAHKGERILLFSTESDFERSKLVHQAKIQGVQELALPKQIHHLAQIPMLGSGKLDLVRLMQLAQQV